MAYNFHYTPTGTGVISGKEVLEQTEDAINDLGNTAISGVEEALDKAEQALTNSANAVDDAQTALNTANNADENATTALNTVNNLSGTVTSLGNRVTTAEGNITNLQGRMTTAEGNVTNLQGRMTTAEGNITTLQSNVSTAQATANSAQQTANTARQQSYVLRYSSSSVTDNSTIAYSTLDNTDNIKTSDKIIDSDGKIFTIVSVDTTNQTVTVGSALIDLALDANVMHLSGDESVSGIKSFIGTRTEFKRTNNDGVILIDNGSFVKGQASNINLGREYHGSETAVGSCISFFGTSLTDNGNVSQVTLSAINNTPDSTLKTEINIKYDKSDLRPRKIELGGDVYPTSNASYNCGLADKKYLSFNGINPGVLSFPDLSAGLDISSYITVPNTSNTYTPTVDGWISIILKSTAGALACFVYQGDHANSNYSATSLPNETEPCVMCSLPVIKNVAVSIDVKGSNAYVVSAKFYPCLGNV